MPEMRFQIEWPDGKQETCYSPSLVIKDHLTPGETYPLDDFVARCGEALAIASERVRQKYGFPCSLAQGEAARIRRTAASFQGRPGAAVRVLAFFE